MRIAKAHKGACERCSSSRSAEFATEVCLHVPGLENLNVPSVFVFPKLAVRLACGHVLGFQIPNEQLSELREYVRSDEGSTHDAIPH